MTEPDTAKGATAEFEFDRTTVERFRATFPRARWDDLRKAWFVPGETAERRIARWQAREQAKADSHADAKGRDAFAFYPLNSPYLEAATTLVVRTPYSRTVVDELRQVPYARWDDALKAWVIPYRSYEELKRRWPKIEAAARRNEPDERRLRREAAKGSDAHMTAQRRNAERRRHRYPVPIDDPPPLERLVSTANYGIVIFTGSTGELVECDGAELYDDVAKGQELVWATWRTPTLEELIQTWPSRAGPDSVVLSRGWWQPTKPELVAARRTAKAIERRRANA